MTPHLLAIDNDPERYNHLHALLSMRGVELSVVCCATCVARPLPTATAVLLDFDLNNGDPCGCGAMPEHANALALVDAVAAAGVPVVVVSGSTLENRRALAVVLRARGATFTLISALETDPELRWLGWLWTRGVFDLHHKGPE